MKALDIRRSLLGEDHPDCGASLAALAEVLDRRDEPAEAERLLRMALEVLHKSGRADTHEGAAIICRLGQVLIRNGKLGEAEGLVRQAIETYKQSCGETHPDHMAALATLASLLQKKGDLNEAEPIWQLLLDMKRQARGSQSLDCANIQTQLALLHQRRGDLKAAEALYRQALDACKEVLGERHPEYAVSLTNLGLLLQRTDDLQGAETVLRQALAIRKEVLSPRHPDYATSLINLAQLVQKRGDTTWARMLLKEAVEVRRTLFGEQHVEFAQSLAALAEVYAQQGDLNKAGVILRQVHEIRKGALGENHPVVAGSLSSLAGVLRRLGDFGGAEALLRESLQIRKTTVGEDHPDYATNLGNLAWLLQRKGDRQGAEVLLTQALNIRRKLLGEQHPEYQQSLERLKNLQSAAPVADVVPANDKNPSRVADVPVAAPVDLPNTPAHPPDPEPLVPESVAKEPQEPTIEEDQSDYSDLKPPAVASLNEFFANCLARPAEAGEDVAEVEATTLEPEPPSEILSPSSERVETHEDISQADELDAPLPEPTVLTLPVEPVPESIAPVDRAELEGSGEEPVGEWDSVTPEPSFSDSEAYEDFDPFERVSVDAIEVVLPTQTDDETRAGVACAADIEPARSFSMNHSSTQLSQELAAMSDRFSELGERLLTAARQLHAPGAPPPDDLIELLGHCRRDYTSLRDRTSELAGSLAIACPPVEQLTNLQDLSGLLDHVAEAEIRQSKSEEQRRRSLSVLDRVLLLSYVGNPDFAPLHDCHAKARDLHHAISEGSWSSLPAEAERLAEGQHPFADLLTMIEDHEELHDDHWANLHESVGQNFGKSLAAAAARCKLVLPAHQEAHR